MSKKVQLTQLEQFFPIKLLEEGSQLLAEDRLLSTEKASKNLWIVSLRDTTKDIEVEILLSGKKIKQFTCDCKGFLKNGLCGHIMAALLVVRDQKVNNKKKEKKEIIREIPKRLTTNLVLQSISHDELNQFVREYARQNRQFSLFLKTRFADKVVLSDNHEKYDELLKSIINLYRQQGKPLTQNAELQITKLGNELLGLANANVEEKHFKEAVAITGSIVKRIGKLYPTAGKGQQSMGNLIILALEIYKKMLSALTISPQLKEEIWHSSSKIFDKPISLQYDLTKSFLELFYLFSEESEKSAQLMDILKANQQNRFRHEGTEALYWAFQLILAQKAPKYFDLEGIKKEVYNSFDLLTKVLDQLKLQKAWSVAEQLLKQALEKSIFKDNHTELTIKTLEIQKDRGNQKQTAKLAKQCFLLTHNFDYFDLFKEVSSGKWDKKLQSLLDAIPVDTTENCQLKAEVYKRDLRYNELIKLLEECASLPLLENYTAFLLEKEKEKVIQLYPKVIEHYLNRHVGRKAAERIRKLIIHLNRLGEKKLASQMLQLIKNKFSERKSLMEELAFFSK